MGNEIVPFDPTQILSDIKTRIKAEFVHLIPEDQWRGLVKREVDEYFALKEPAPPKNNYDYDPRFYKPATSPFRELIWDMLKDESKEKVREFLQSGEWSELWDGQELGLSAKVEALVLEAAPKMLNAAFGKILLQSLVEGVQQKLRDELANQVQYG